METLRGRIVNTDLTAKIAGLSACAPVSVRDQNDNEIATPAAGSIYNVIVFSGIQDNGSPYTNSIIDNTL